MKYPSLIVTALAMWSLAAAEESPVGLPEVTVYSPRVANQEPVGTFATPVTSLRYEPMVDLESRNLAEAQADVTIRGGIFENTGMQVGALPVFDPQTGHYLAELPIAPAMLGAPVVLTGVAQAETGFNANAGSIAYQWRPISTRGAVELAGGQYSTVRESLYQGYTSGQRWPGQRFGLDAEVDHAQGNSSVAYGDHRFTRYAGRIQSVNSLGQTDLFVGYQAKFFGWPDLYTPFNVNESENLQTTLVMLNHRVELAGGDFLQFGGYYRRNKDDYEFNRLIPGLFNPYQHTTQVRGLSASGRNQLGGVEWNYAADYFSDDLKSTSLIYGKFMSRAYTKLALAPEKTFEVAPNQQVEAKAGLTYDDTNRDPSAVSPLAEVAWQFSTGNEGVERIWLNYAGTSQVADYTALNSNARAGLFRGNPNLGREKAKTTELGWRRTAGEWSEQAAVFYRQDDRLVDWTYTRTSTSARSANAVNTDTFGVETLITYDTRIIKVVLGYTYLDKTSDYLGAPVDASFYALNYARHRLTLAATVRLGGGFEVRVDNEARIQQKNLLRQVGGNQAIISSAGLYYLPAGVPGLEISVAADNLWNSRFQKVPQVPAAGREISGGVAYRW